MKHFALLVLAGAVVACGQRVETAVEPPALPDKASELETFLPDAIPIEVPEVSEPVYTIQGPIIAPAPITQCRPQFPQAIQEGRVPPPRFIYEVVVSSEGRIVSNRLLKASHQGEPYDSLESAIRESFADCRFRPAQLHGKPVAVKMNITLRGHIRR